MKLARFVLPAVLLVALTSLATAQQLRFTVWSGNEAHLSMLNGFADGFAETHPGVSVQFDVIPFGDYVQKVTLQLAGGNPPDLGWLAEASAPTFIDAGVLADVSDALRNDPDYDFADFSEPALGLWERGDAVYGVPFSTSPFIVYFNRDLFEQAGLTPPDVLAEQGAWTWETLKESAAAIADGSDAFGFESVDGEGYGARVWHTLVPIVRGYGGEAWSDGACRLDSPEAVEAVQLYHDMVYEDASAVPPGEQGDFFTGRSGITITQLSRVSKLAEADFDWGLAPMPSGPAEDVAVIGQAAVVVFEAGQQTELATEFLAYMTNKENVAVMAEFFPPARRSVLDSEAFLSSNPMVTPQQMEIVASGIAGGRVLPNHPNFPQIDAAARPVFDELWNADADVAAVMTRVCDAIDAQLQ